MSFDSIWNNLQAWFLDHGWRILLILVIASLARRFGMVFLRQVVNHSIDSSERFENKRDRKLRADTVLGMLDSILKVAIYVVIGLLILSELNVLKFLAPLLATAGVLSLLLGFGIQTFVKDFVSGFFIVAENQYRVGDVVSIHGSTGSPLEGLVVRITLRTTVIRDNDGAIHFIPNGNIVHAANQTFDNAKINIELRMPIGADLLTAEKHINQLGLAMQKEAEWHRNLLQAPYFHGVQAFEEESVIVEVRAKTRPAEQWRASSELRRRLAQLLSEENFFAIKKVNAKTVAKK